jgi:hypothetical protein
MTNELIVGTAEIRCRAADIGVEAVHAGDHVFIGLDGYAYKERPPIIIAEGTALGFPDMDGWVHVFKHI